MRERDPFFAIADPTRREILRLLGTEGSMRAGAIAARFPSLSRVAVSKHLHVLLEAGLVSVEQRGREFWYSLERVGMFDLRRLWFEQFAPVFDADLQVLRRTVEDPGEMPG